jgi:hypothetical protein
MGHVLAPARSILDVPTETTDQCERPSSNTPRIASATHRVVRPAAMSQRWGPAVHRTDQSYWALRADTSTSAADWRPKDAITTSPEAIVKRGTNASVGGMWLPGILFRSRPRNLEAFGDSGLTVGPVTLRPMLSRPWLRWSSRAAGREAPRVPAVRQSRLPHPRPHRGPQGAARGRSARS